MEKKFLTYLSPHYGIIYKITRMYAQHEEERRDLFQEIIFQLWKSFPSYLETHKFSTWMYRVALNTAITQVRKSASKIHRKTESIEGQTHLASVSGKVDSTEVLYQAIQHLTKVDKALIMLYLEEKSYREIAGIMDISESNVGVRINRVKKKLKTILNKLDYHYG